MVTHELVMATFSSNAWMRLHFLNPLQQYFTLIWDIVTQSGILDLYGKSGSGKNTKMTYYADYQVKVSPI